MQPGFLKSRIFFSTLLMNIFKKYLENRQASFGAVLFNDLLEIECKTTEMGEKLIKKFRF